MRRNINRQSTVRKLAFAGIVGETGSRRDE